MLKINSQCKESTIYKLSENIEELKTNGEILKVYLIIYLLIEIYLLSLI